MLSDEKLIKIFNDFLDDEVIMKYISHYYDISTPRGCFNKEAIETIERNIKFFQDIPNNKLENVLICLTEIFQEYDVNNQNEVFARMINDSVSIYDKKPVVKLNQDIKTIKNFKEMFSRIAGFTEISKEVPNINNVLNRILNDLEKKEFKIINKSKYYRPSKITKKEFKIFFKRVRNTFDLKNVSLEEKEMVDKFTSYMATK